MSIFVEYPFIALLIGAVLLGTYFYLKRTKILISAATLWLIYGVYELMMRSPLGCAPECNIRVDLLVIYPVLLLSLLLASGQTAYLLLKQSHRSGK